MKIETMMERYYQNRLAALPAASRPAAFSRTAADPPRFRIMPRWENAIGAAVTAAWMLHLFLPERWFLFGRITSALRIGF